MTDLDEYGRPEPPPAAGETATVLGFLDYQRATLAWKCADLDAAAPRATVAASSNLVTAAALTVAGHPSSPAAEAPGSQPDRRSPIDR